MILATVGCDGTGKSSIANQVCQDMNGEYTHFSNPKDMLDGKKQYFDFLNNTNGNKFYVCDRFHDGEWVYAPIYRGYVANYMNEFEKEIIKKHNYMLAYVTADLQTIINRTRVRGEDFVKEEHFQTVLDNYMNNFMMEQTMPFTIVDTTNTTLQENIAQVEEDMEKVNRIWDRIKFCSRKCYFCKAVTPIALPRGNVRAKYMIVGQNPGGKGKGTEEYITMWSGGKNSSFFIDVLKKAGIYLDCWFTNVVLCSTKDNKITETQVDTCKANMELQIDLIKPEKIFTLGKEATKYMNQKFPNENIIQVPHPSYIKRFFSSKEKELNDYIELFKANK